MADWTELGYIFMTCKTQQHIWTRVMQELYRPVTLMVSYKNLGSQLTKVLWTERRRFQEKEMADMAKRRPMQPSKDLQWIITTRSVYSIPMKVMEAGVVVEAQLHVFLASALDRRERSTSHPSLYRPVKSCRYSLNRRLGWPKSRSQSW
jgi:hypothetical protein